MTAQIFDANGNILWEFPNFREKSPALTPLLELQYPDFDEAKANETDKVEIKFKTINGIAGAFNKTQSSSYADSAKVSSAYVSIFNDMASLLKPDNGFSWWKKKEEPREELLPAQETPKPVAVKPAEVKPEMTKPEDTRADEVVKPEVIKEEPIKEETIK
jgi:hypothetical protein